MTVGALAVFVADADNAEGAAPLRAAAATLRAAVRDRGVMDAGRGGDFPPPGMPLAVAAVGHWGTPTDRAYLLRALGRLERYAAANGVSGHRVPMLAVLLRRPGALEPPTRTPGLIAALRPDRYGAARFRVLPVCWLPAGEADASAIADAAGALAAALAAPSELTAAPPARQGVAAPIRGCRRPRPAGHDCWDACLHACQGFCVGRLSAE